VKIYVEEDFNNDSKTGVLELQDTTSSLRSRARGIVRLVGAGFHLLLVGIVLEGITVGIQQWASLPLSLTVETQIFMTVPCIAVCLFGMIWFNRSLNLREVHLLNGKNELITYGPFSYVRHPLYATLLITMPPLLIIWRSDLLFIVPWVLIVIVSHYIVRLEERGLIEAFGNEYIWYQREVPPLLPLKGDGGRRFRTRRP
jgi:protein-S-isoprenylcysteine O-methyltransferase Ste14